MEDEMTKKELSYEPIRLLKNDLKHKERMWLEKHGWKESCQFIDSCWRWSKKIKGKIMSCNKSEAIGIELKFLD